MNCAINRMMMSVAALLLATSPAISHVQPAAEGPSLAFAGQQNAKVTLVYQHVLPDLPGKSLKGVLVEYGPGGSSPSHRHAKSALIYATVLSGTVRSQVNGGPILTYRAGENWTELPGDHHGVSANASETERATILAVFVVDTADTQLTVPDRP